MVVSVNRACADRIPSLGHGGFDVADTLIQLASNVTPGQSIVDLGPYLGSTTAYLSLGAQSGIPIHAYDTWDATMCDLRGKARYYHDMGIPDDFLPVYMQNMLPFGANLTTHQGDIREATWGGGPIGLFVDDIGVEWMEAKMRTFGTHLVTGSVLALLDYFWFEKKGDQFTLQRDYMNTFSDRYRFIRREGIAALFEVIG